MSSGERRSPKSPKSGRNIDYTYSAGIKMLISRMEALDIEEEKHFEKNPDEDDEKWVKENRHKLKEHLINLIDENSD